MRLYKRPGSPFWWVSIGRKTRKSSRTTDKAKAREFGQLLQERLWRRNTLGDRSAISWKEASGQWLKSSKRARKRDREFLKWLDPEIGADPVSAVADPDALESLRTLGIAAGWAHSTVDRLMNTVRSVLKYCKRQRWLSDDPVISMFGEDDSEPRFLTPAQFQALASELPPHLALAAQFAVLTLLRKSSQARLTWDRIDLVGRRAWIPGAQMKMHRTHGFPLSSAAIEVLKQARALNPGGDRVFQFEGRPIANFHTAAFKKAAGRARVLPLRWHDLRHTGASWAVQSGRTLQELQVLGDWKSYRSVLKYAFLAPDNAVSAAESVAQMLVQPESVVLRKVL